MGDVVAFYDEHPINEPEVLSKLAEAGRDLARLQPEDLLPFDQDHYGGTEATDLLARGLELGPGSRVLDICSGLGGTSRYLAHRYGCKVVGVDLNQTRTEGAVALTRRVGLHAHVTHVCGDALALDFPAESFDAAISQESFLHIADKVDLFGCCRGVLRKGGRLGFTDWIALAGITDADRRRLSEGIAAVDIVSPESYREYLEQSGFRHVRFEDVSPGWRVILRDRLRMYESLREETVRRFGEARYRPHIAAYRFVVKLNEEGRLGGGRFFAEK